MAKNDFFENLITYGEQERLAEEARLAEEEAARQESLAAAEAARLALEQAATAPTIAEEAATSASDLGMIPLILALLAAGMLALLLLRRKK